MVRSLALSLSIALAALAVSCGGARKVTSPSTAAPETSPATAPSDAAGTQTMPVEDARAELERRVAELEQQRTTMQLPEPAISSSAASEGATPMGSVPRSTDASCKPARTERCTSSCTLSDSICTNASRICELASQLPGDGWAATKCAQAKQTCESAHETCCSCQ